MIYDLKELNDDMGNDEYSVAKLQVHALLAIAERLEALVEAQKPRLVYLEPYEEGEGIIVNPAFVIDVCWRKWDGGACAGIVTASMNHERDEHIRVKGTLVEVLARLRGDK